MEYTDADIQQVANRFIEELRIDLSQHEFDAMCVANAAETNPDICHSHDYLDANMSMLAAMEDHVGTAPVCPINGYSVWFIELWNAAWSMAKSNCIGIEPARKHDESGFVEQV
jgi:hypothetical protein